MRVDDVMSRGVETIDVSASCHEAARRMFRAKVRRLPAVDPDGKLVGIVTETDLLRRLIRDAEWCCEDVPAIVVWFP